MADHTAIEWADATWNPATGCSVISPGCTHCYAMRLAGGRLRHHPSRAGLTTPSKAGDPVWNGRISLNHDWLGQPLLWKRPRRIFVCAHGDLFHEGVPDDFIDRVFAVMALCPQHTFQVLTKRPERMRAYMANPEREALWMNAVADLFEIQPRLMDRRYPIMARREPWLPLPNVWLGTSVENQEWADRRRDDLAALAAADWATFVSYEPALGPVDWRGWEFLCWLISGGESGPKARPSHPDWHRAARDFCIAHGIPYFFKQWGEWGPHQPVAGGDLGGDLRADRVRIVHPSGRSDVEIFDATGGHNTESGSRYMINLGKSSAGRLLDGREWNEAPR